MTSSVNHVTFDCSDAYALAGFWAQVVGGRRQDEDFPGDPEVLVTSAGPPLLFIQVPDEKVVKNRVHLDLRPDTTRDEEVARLLALGAQLYEDHRRPDGTGWVTLTDPEGNELCVERSAAERGQAPVDSGPRAMPPVHAADERTMLEGMLEWYREGVVRKVAGLSQAHATTSPLRSGTTVAGLVKHLALVEDTWFWVRAAGRPEPEPWASAPFDADPDWEFSSARDEPLGDAVALYEAACARSREVAASRSLDDTATDERGRTSSLRFVLLHLIEETARHLGHLDVLCELADGRTGE